MPLQSERLIENRSIWVILTSLCTMDAGFGSVTAGLYTKIVLVTGATDDLINQVVRFDPVNMKCTFGSRLILGHRPSEITVCRVFITSIPFILSTTSRFRSTFFATLRYG